MAPALNRQSVLRQRPRAALEAGDFEARESAVPAPGPGEALTRTLCLSIDPANRAEAHGPRRAGRRLTGAAAT